MSREYIKVETSNLAMNVQVNQGVVGDIAKLMMHRLIVRQIRRDPSLLDRARAAQAKIAERFEGRPFVNEWNELLKLPPEQLLSRLTSRDSEMARLRSSSPFGLTEGVDFSDYDLRIRIRRAAKRVAERSFARHIDKFAPADFR